MEDIKNICYEYAKAHLTYDEPIPSFKNRYPNILESVLMFPQKMVNRELVYKTLPQQGSVLFYEMIKLHPFLNGNKRVACVSLMAFLMLNNKWLKADWRKLYNMAVDVASSFPENRRMVLETLNNFINDGLVDV